VKVAAVLLMVALWGVAFLVGGGASEPAFRDYGVVHTRFGDAHMICGRHISTPCGKGTTLAYVDCGRVGRWMDDALSAPDPLRVLDTRTRVLAGREAPSGNYWSAGCGGIATVESN
jgi:hypothetical protein